MTEAESPQDKESKMKMMAAPIAQFSFSEKVHEDDPDLVLERAAQGRIVKDGPYARCFRDVTIHSRDGVLSLAGCVPSFYLMQMLQALLKDIAGVARIANHVEVVNARGLSSVRPE